MASLIADLTIFYTEHPITMGVLTLIVVFILTVTIRLIVGVFQ